MSDASIKDPMIQANCRARFTANDFDFIVKTLRKSPGDAVSLVELLADSDTRDAILDHDLLFDAILSQNGHLTISPQFYFYVLTRHVLKASGLTDRKLCDYIASLLEAFSRTARLQSSVDPCCGRPVEYVSDLLLALRDASPVQTFLIRAHVGNYSLFLSGIFHENVQSRTQRGAPDCSFYEDVGRMNYRVAAGHTVARRCELSEVYAALAGQFHEVRLALNELSGRLLHMDDGCAHSLLLG